MTTINLQVVERGEWGAGLHNNRWHILHIPSGILFGWLPRRAYASVAHALRRLSALPSCPTPARVGVCLAWEMGYDPGETVNEHSATYRWTARAADTLRRVQGPAWGYDPDEPPPADFTPPDAPIRVRAA